MRVRVEQPARQNNEGAAVSIKEPAVCAPPPQKAAASKAGNSVLSATILSLISACVRICFAFEWFGLATAHATKKRLSLSARAHSRLRKGALASHTKEDDWRIRIYLFSPCSLIFSSGSARLQTPRYPYLAHPLSQRVPETEQLGTSDIA